MYYNMCKICKYYQDEDGKCYFYDMGSGNKIDMPCYQAQEIIKKVEERIKNRKENINENEISN